jgi:CRISPR-associated endonuclease Cas1
MFSQKDLEFRTIYVLTCLQSRDLRVSNGMLLVEDTKEKKVLTKMPFQKILALFVIGHIRITTPLIEKCEEHNVFLFVMKTTLRPVFYWANAAETNFQVRKLQYELYEHDLTVARRLVENKVQNHIALLQRTRRNDELTRTAIDYCLLCREAEIHSAQTITDLMAVEGRAAKLYFRAYFQEYHWSGRNPRVKNDYINTTLDFGYTLLFNFMECYLRMFGFDVYVGVYHRLWFKRKSLVCDIQEPFRGLIDHTVRTGINRGQIKVEDFENHDGEWHLKREKIMDYNRLFFEVLVNRKMNIFRYVQQFYWAFMQQKSTHEYPFFEL